MSKISTYNILAYIARTREPATGYTALHWAAKQNNTDIVKLLAGTYEQVGEGEVESCV